MKDFNAAFTIVSSLTSAVFIAGGFYKLVMWRLKKLEEKQVSNDEMRERVVRIETKIDLLLNNPPS